MILQAHNPREKVCSYFFCSCPKQCSKKTALVANRGLFKKSGELLYEFTQQKNRMHRIYRNPSASVCQKPTPLGKGRRKKIGVKNGSCPPRFWSNDDTKKSLKPPRFQEQFILLILFPRKNRYLNRRKPQRMAFFDARKMPANGMQDCFP